MRTTDYLKRLVQDQDFSKFFSDLTIPDEIKAYLLGDLLRYAPLPIAQRCMDINRVSRHTFQFGEDLLDDLIFAHERIEAKLPFPDGPETQVKIARRILWILLLRTIPVAKKALHSHLNPKIISYRSLPVILYDTIWYNLKRDVNREQVADDIRAFAKTSPSLYYDLDRVYLNFLLAEIS